MCPESTEIDEDSIEARKHHRKGTANLGSRQSSPELDIGHEILGPSGCAGPSMTLDLHGNSRRHRIAAPTGVEGTNLIQSLHACAANELHCVADCAIGNELAQVALPQSKAKGAKCILKVCWTEPDREVNVRVELSSANVQAVHRLPGMLKDSALVLPAWRQGGTARRYSLRPEKTTLGASKIHGATPTRSCRGASRS